MRIRDALGAVDDKRIGLGYTFPELSEKAGVGEYTVRKWLTGANLPTLVTFVLVLDALGMDFVIRDREEQEGKQ